MSMKSIFKKEFYSSNKIMSGLTAVFCAGMILMYAVRTAPYLYNPSALIGLWQGFAGANSSLVPKNTVIFSEGGYDGQFFFLNAAYLFSSESGFPPVLDSFLIRFTRIGFSFLSGCLSSVLGWEHYAVSSAVLLLGFHILSSVCLFKLLPEKNRPLSVLYLFSPFSANANLLLVADSIQASFFIFTLYLLEKSGISLRSGNSSLSSVTGYSRRNLFPVLFGTVLLFLFIKETAVIYISAFLLMSLIQGRVGEGSILASALLAYSAFLVYIHFYMKFFAGTYPLNFVQLSDFPLFGFIKSIKLENLMSIKPFLREMSKFPLLILLVLFLCGPLFVFRNFSAGRVMPALLILSVAPALIAEQGYWLTFDNISRFFTLSIPIYVLSVPVSGERKIRLHTAAVSAVIFFLFISLMLRTVWIKTPMEFFVKQTDVLHSHH